MISVDLCEIVKPSRCTRTMETLAQFIENYGITCSANRVGANPNMGDMPPGSSHYEVTLARGRRRFRTYFSMGPAHTSEPTVRDVLSCLQSDVSGFICAGSFEEWASDLGFSTDSRAVGVHRKAERIYKLIGKQAKVLREFLGEEAFDELIGEVEPD